MSTVPFQRSAALILAVAALSACGCATSARREAYLELNPGMSAEKQEMIRRGEVVVGMSRNDVLAAWGDPNFFVPGYSDPTVRYETWVYRYHLVFGTGYYRLLFRNGRLSVMDRVYY
ncbi:MAG TPA: hypothetical protein PLI51_04765 [bacterium]|nr:hypothetical protein [bacterium]HPQ66023.1 hypothetical protein [bacterium]